MSPFLFCAVKYKFLSVECGIGLVKAAHTSAVHRLFVGVVEHSQLAVRVIVAEISSCGDLLALIRCRISIIIGYNQCIQPVIIKITVILNNYSGAC